MSKAYKAALEQARQDLKMLEDSRAVLRMEISKLEEQLRPLHDIISTLARFIEAKS